MRVEDTFKVIKRINNASSTWKIEDIISEFGINI